MATADSLKSQDVFEQEKPPLEHVLLALGRAEDRLSRLDERVRLSGFADGWRARADIRAVIGALWDDGELVHAEDLLLRINEADIRAPDPATLRGWTAYRGRQRAARGGDELLSWRGVAWLCGRIENAPPPGRRVSTATDQAAGPNGVWAALEAFFARLRQGSTDGPRAGVEDCLGVLDAVAEAPTLLLAAAFMEAWRLVDPLPAQRFAGPLLAAVVLRSQRRFSAGLFPLEVGVRRNRMPPQLEWAALSHRLAYWLQTFALAAELELEEIVRLGHRKTQMERLIVGGRRSSHAPAFAALLIELPVVTTELIGRRLQITPQASLQLIKRFGGALQELTGRSRYRVWRL